MPREVNESAINLIKQWEGLKLKPYLCPAGVPTVGYGTTVYPNGKKVSLKNKAISEEDADEFLRHDVSKIACVVEDMVSVSLTDNQFGALVSFAYNVGTSALLNSSLLRKLNMGDYSSAAEQFLRWVYGGGKVLPGLVKRRQAERALFIHNS